MCFFINDRKCKGFSFVRMGIGSWSQNLAAIYKNNLSPELFICHHITKCDKGGKYLCPWFATASDLLWRAACYGHPYPSPYPQCDSSFVCCQAVCLTVAQTHRHRVSDVDRVSGWRGEEADRLIQPADS